MIGATVRIAGWVHRRRLLKSVAFLIVRDAAGLAQVVVTDPAVRAELEKLTEETVVEVTATVTANDTAPAGVELTDPTVRPLGPPAVPPPFDLYRPALTASLPTQLDNAPTALRHPTRSAALRISAAAVAGFRAALDAQRLRGDPHPEGGQLRPPRAGRTCSRWTGSAGPRTWPSRRSSTSS